MRCEHDLTEMETACADGMCPICLAEKLHRIVEAVERHNKSIDYFYGRTRDEDVILYRTVEEIKEGRGAKTSL